MSLKQFISCLGYLNEKYFDIGLYRMQTKKLFYHEE
jgi:hypothetical protein